MALERVFLKKGFAEVVDALLADIGSGMGGRLALTDANEGSVVRTLAEAFARELAVCYEQLDAVYRNAYLDSASGPALDNVVALLGIERQRGGHLEGLAHFSRGQPAPEDIHIPLGTLVAGRDVPLFATCASVKKPTRSCAPAPAGWCSPPTPAPCRRWSRPPAASASTKCRWLKTRAGGPARWK